jgi:hypothetical protein
MTTDNPPLVGGVPCQVRAERLAHNIDTLSAGNSHGRNAEKVKLSAGLYNSDVPLRTNDAVNDDLSAHPRPPLG